MKILKRKKYLLNNTIKGRQSLQLFIPDTLDKSGIDGTDILELLNVVKNELIEMNLKNEHDVISELINNLKLKL